MRTFFFHDEKVAPVELSADKSSTVPKPKTDEHLEPTTRLRIEVGFPSTPVNCSHRIVKIGSAHEKPVTVEFPPDESAAEFLVPKNESLRLEFTTVYHKTDEKADPRIEVLTAEFFAKQTQNVIKEPSPLSFNVLGDVETYISKEEREKKEKSIKEEEEKATKEDKTVKEDKATKEEKKAPPKEEPKEEKAAPIKSKPIPK